MIKRGWKWIIKVWKTLDYSLLLPLAIICIIGLIMIYSASSVMTLIKFKEENLPPDHFFQSQLTVLLVGMFVMFIMKGIPYTIWKKRVFATGIIVFSLLLLSLALVKGDAANGSKAWVLGIQPAEFVKLGVIIVLSRYYARSYSAASGRRTALTWLYILITLGLIGLQPDLGTALLIVAIVLCMIFCSGIPAKVFMKRMLFTSIFWGPGIYLAGKYVLTPEQVSRFTAFIDPFQDPEDDGFHLINSFEAIASGGIKGLGLGNSGQKYGYLPEPHTDFIMAIVSEELGLLGVAIILGSLTFIIMSAFKIARQCSDPFGSMLAIGIGSMLGIQMFVNTGGILGILPLTGVPLPFVSYGGSSLLMNLMAMGLLLNVSAHVKEEAKQKQRQPSERKPHLAVVK